jgi:hypothetical protein
VNIIPMPYRLIRNANRHGPPIAGNASSQRVGGSLACKALIVVAEDDEALNLVGRDQGRQQSGVQCGPTGTPNSTAPSAMPSTSIGLGRRTAAPRAIKRTLQVDDAEPGGIATASVRTTASSLSKSEPRSLP